MNLRPEISGEGVRRSPPHFDHLSFANGLLEVRTLAFAVMDSGLTKRARLMTSGSLSEERPSKVRSRSVGLLAVLTLFLAYLELPTAQAQLPVCKIYSVFPPGAQAGSEVEVQVTSGTDHEELQSLEFNQPGITAQPKMVTEYGKKVPSPDTFVVKVGKDVPPGYYEVRARGLFGLSNPRTFHVGTQPEVQEVEPNDSDDKAQILEINQMLSGRSDKATDVDCYKFVGKKGQRLLVRCQADRIDSRFDGMIEVYDAKGRRIGRAQRSEVLMHGDPVADVTLPADGEYTVKVRDFVFAGGTEYPYRLTVSSAPWIDFVLPAMGTPGQTGEFTLYGRNLPEGIPTDLTVDGRPLQKQVVKIAVPEESTTLEVDANLDPVQAGTDGFQYTLMSPQGASNRVLIGFAAGAVVTETEPNNAAAEAQKISLPADVVGQFQSLHDQDVYEFTAKAGEVYYIEMLAQRIGSTVDPYFIVEQVTKPKDDKGEEQVKQLTTQDDNSVNLLVNVFETLSDDPVWKFSVPADGTYRVRVRDRYASSRADVRLIYRLQIRPEQPDFRVIVVPQEPGNNTAGTGALALRKGENVAVKVAAFRQDGFDGPILLKAEGLPDGVTCNGAVIGQGETLADLVFSAAENAAPWSGRIQVTSSGVLDDPAKVRAAETAEKAVRPAEDALPKLKQAAEQATAKVKPLQDKHDAVAKQAAAKPDDANLKNQLKQALAALDKAKAVEAAAMKSLQDGEKKLADAIAAVKTTRTEQEKAARKVSRVARTGTLMWKVANNVAADARVSRSLGLSVIDEVSPFQVVAEGKGFEFDVNQGRQILVPLKIHRREGFAADLKLAAAGLPKAANIQVPALTIKKDESDNLLRLFVNNNSKVGAYTLYLNAQGQFSYSRNPGRAKRARKIQKQLTEKVKQTADALKAAQTKAAEVAKALQAAQQREKTATAALAAAKKQNTADDTVAKAEAELNKAAEEVKQVTEAKSAADADVKTADAEQKQTTADKKKIDAEVKSAEAAAKAKNINLTQPSTALIIRVQPAPVQVTAAVPGGGKLKRGEKLDIKVTLKRQNNFTGPVTVKLPLPAGVTGLTAAPLTIPADQKEGVLTVQAAGNATEGALANLVVQAEMEHNGNAAVDAPINITVSK